MRVLHVIPAVAPRYGGPSVAIVGYCRSLRQQGVDVLIATTNADGSGELPVPVGTVTDVGTVPAIFFRRRGEAFKWSSALAAWLRESVRDWDLVHVHAVFSHSSLAAARACRHSAVPYVVRPLGSLNPWALRQKALQKRVLLWTSVRAMLDGAAAIHYTTDDEQERSEATIGPLPAMVVPLGVEADLLERPIVPPAERGRYVLALTRLHPVKNLETLIDAFLSIPGPVADGWRLVIAGAGDPAYQAALAARAARGGMRRQVVFAGWVDGQEKLELISQAALFALPSHTENFGAGLVDALARGVPAIVSRDVNLAGEIERARAGWVVDAGVPALSSVLALAMEQPSERARRAAAARAFAQRYSWPAIGDMLVRHYARLCASAAPASPDAVVF